MINVLNHFKQLHINHLEFTQDDYNDNDIEQLFSEWITDWDIDSFIQEVDNLAPDNESGFEEHLQDYHAEDYMGTDDEMGDSFSNMLVDMSMDELVGQAQLFVNL